MYEVVYLMGPKMRILLFFTVFAVVLANIEDGPTLKHPYDIKTDELDSAEETDDVNWIWYFVISVGLICGIVLVTVLAAVIYAISDRIFS